MLPRFKRNIISSFDDALIAYESYGEGLPLVFCNGLGCNTYIWSYVLPYFQKDYRIITWDVRGHGHSQEPDDLEQLTMQTICRDLEVVLDDAGVDKAVLFGHSMGSQVIFEMCREHRDRVLGLVPICGSHEHIVSTFPGGTGLAEQLGTVVRALRTLNPLIMPLWRGLLPNSLSYALASRTAVNGPLVNPGDLRPYLEHLAEIHPFVFYHLVELLQEHSADDLLDDLDVPVLIIAGKLDNMVPLVASQRIRERLPHAELRVIPHGTHCAPIEQPDLVNLSIERFLQKEFGALSKELRGTGTLAPSA